MRSYLLLWLTQFISELGGVMTAYALVIWPYAQEGSALLMVCSYAPYVIFGIFAGVLKAPKSRVRVIWWCLLTSVGTEVLGIVMCLVFRGDKQIWRLEE